MSFKDPTIPNRANDRRRGLIYPSPFFDVAQSYMPPTVKELLKWCAYFFYTDPLIGSVVYKIAEYPVTDFVYNSEDEHVRDKWKDVLEKTLNIKPFIIEIGLDFFTFGNAFISINMPFKRLLECPECKHKVDVSDLKYKFKNYKFSYKCPSCEEEVVGEVHDIPVKSVHDINFIRWDPKNIEIEFNPLTGRSRYRYRVPNRIRRAIQQGKREILNEVPWIFVKAVKENKDIILSMRNLFHFKRPTLAEQDQGWGKPLILHSMKRLFYLYVLRRAQEAIALQRILPLEFIFPQANATQDPYCCSLGTIIATKNGLKPASEVLKGDYIRTHKGRWKKVEGAINRKVRKDEQVYKFTVAGIRAFPFELSEEHPILIIKRPKRFRGYRSLGEAEWVFSKDVEEGDYACYPVHRTTWESFTLDLKDYCQENAATEKYVYKRLDQESADIYEYFEKEGVPSFQVESGDMKCFLSRMGWSKESYANAKSAYSQQDKISRRDRYVPVTKDLAYLIGIYIAEGCPCGSGVQIALHSKETSIMDRIDSCLDSIGVKHGTRRFNGNDARYYIGDIFVANLLSLSAGKGAQNKRIPLFLGEAPREIAIETLRGVWDGDGCFFESNGTKRAGLKTVSPQLAIDARNILLSEGIIPSVTRQVPREGEISKLPYYQVNCNGSQKDALSKLFQGDKVIGYSKRAFIRNGYVHMRVVKKEVVDVDNVRGFQVEGDKSFCVAGVATHNSHVNLHTWSGRVQDEIRKWRCVSPDSLVETKEGLCPAGEIKEGNWLKNRNGVFERVIRRHKRPLDPGEMAYRLRVRGLSAVDTVFSEEHPIWAAKKQNKGNGHKLGKPEFIRVDGLRPGDYVGYPIYRQIDDVKEIDLAEHVDRAVTEKWVYVDHVDSNTPDAFEYLEGEGQDSEARRLFGVNPTKVAQRAIREKKTLRRIPRYVPIDKDLGYVLGIYAAKGNSTASQVAFSLHAKETHIVKLLDRFFEKRFSAKKTGGYKTPNCVQYMYSSVIAAQLFHSVCPGFSRTKHVPKLIKHAPESIALAFLRGVLDGDGSYYDRKTTLKTSSIQLAEGVRQLILSFQVMPEISYEKECDIGKKTVFNGAYTVQVSEEQNEKLLALFSEKEYSKIPTSRIGTFKDGFAWFRIKAIEEASTRTVIGFSMEGDATFCTWGLSTHNTDPNYISVVPVPLGFERLGGDGRALMLGPEIEIANKEITGGMGVPLEFVFGGLCLSSRTLTVSSNGFVYIGDLHVGSDNVKQIDVRVANHEGTSNAILAHNIGRKKAVRLRTREGYLLDAAPTHPMLTLSRDLSLQFKTIDELEIDDYLVQKFGSELWSSKFYKFSDFCEKRHASYPKHMSLELGRLLGYIGSEGCIDHERIRLGNKDKKLIDDYCKIFHEEFCATPSVYTKVLSDGDNFYEAELWSVDIAKFFKNIGAAKSCYEVTIPDCVLQSPREVIVEFLRGYFEGDGTVSIKPTGNGAVSLSSKSRELLQQVQMILQNMGIESTVYGETKTSPISKLVIRKTLARFESEIGFLSNRKRLALKSIISDRPDHVKIPYVKDVIGRLKKEHPIPRWTYRTFIPELKNKIYSASSAARALGRSDKGFILSAISDEKLKAEVSCKGIKINASDLEAYCKEHGIPEHTKGGWPRFYKKSASLHSIRSADLSAVAKHAPEIMERIARISEGDLRFDKIVEIEEINDLVPMSDLSVPGPECYIASGLICHNSWSGSSVSLRTLENHFLMYRRLLMRFLNFVKGHLVTHLGLPDVELKFTEFKMADDIQRKQLVVQLNAAQKISDETLLTELGFDHAKEQKKIREQISKLMELQEMQMKAQAQAQGEAQITSVKYQIQAQEAQIKAQQQMQERMNAEGMLTPEQQQQQQMEQEQQAQTQPQQQPPQGAQEAQGGVAERELAQQAIAQGMAPEGTPQRKEESQRGIKGGSNVVPFDVDAIAKRWATRLMSMGQAQRNNVLIDLQSRMPNMYQVVLQYLGMTPPGGTAADVKMRPLPEKLPPRRKESPV